MEVLPPEDRYEYVKVSGESQLAIGATVIAADFAWVAKFDPSAVYENKASFARATSDRGMGFRDPQRMALAHGTQI